MRTIKLKETKTTEYFITEMSKIDYQVIIKANDSNKLGSIEKLYPINFKGIEGIGSIKNLTVRKVAMYVDYVKGFTPENNKKLENRKIAFRDYSKTEKKQKETLWLVNMCEDVTSSARTVIKLLTLPYVCIWNKKKAI